MGLGSLGTAVPARAFVERWSNRKLNSLLKALTIITVITGLVGAVAGIFGMSFDTPIPRIELLGFVAVNAAMFAVSAGIIAIALWRRWF